MKTSQFGMDIHVHGHTVREYQHNGKTYIEGRKGSEFTIHLENLTPRRVLAVVSVDGLSVMDGKDASFESGGYVLGPYEKLDIPGWRLDLQNVAKFMFTVAGQSYAATVDRPKNVGVIGCAFFEERPTFTFTSHKKCPSAPWEDIRWLSRFGTLHGGSWSGTAGREASYKSDVDLNDASGALCADNGVQSSSVNFCTNDCCPTQQLGTGFGAQADHQVNTVTFARADLSAVLEVVYDTREGLVSRGVELHPRPAVYTPQAFPSGFCKPPVGWTGR